MTNTTISFALSPDIRLVEAFPFGTGFDPNVIVETDIPLTAGGGTVALAATGATWAWLFREQGLNGQTRVCALPVSGTTLPYAGLTNLDPVTFLPTPGVLSAAWVASLATETARATAAEGANTAAIAMKVSKGELVFNVLDYGAVGDYSTGTTGTVNTSFVNAALAAAAAAIAANPVATARVVVPGTTGNGYVINDTITVPSGVELDMRAPFIYTGPTGRAALIIGTSAAQYYRKHVIRVQRYALTDWANEADAGIVIRNHYASIFHIAQCSNFTVGLTVMGDTNNGFSYNEVHLGALIDNKVGIDCTNDTGGWCNENSYFLGRFACTSTTYNSLDRWAIRITSRAGTPYYNNANIFHKPSFELQTRVTAGVGTCMDVVYGNQNRTIAARHESNSAGVLIQRNLSANNWMDFAYTDEGANAPVMSSLGTSSSGGITRDYTSMIDKALRTVYKAESVHKSACFYDGGTSVNVPGLTVGTSSTSNTDARAASLLVLNANYLEIPASRYAGFYMSTRVLKQFSVLRDAEVGFGGRLFIRCYDTSGTIISTTGAVQTSAAVSNPAYGTAFGGAFAMGVDAETTLHFGVTSAVDSVFIGISGGTAAARLRTLSVGTLSPVNPACWLAFPDNGANYGTVPPTAGTWAVGREVVNAAPASGQPAKWVCTVAGAPGTWVALTGTTGSVFVPTDVQTFTATGTWTKPVVGTPIAVDVIAIAPGGPGGSGRRDAAGTVRCGGGGGGGGGVSRATIPASLLGATVTVTLPTAGTGGAAVTVDATNGNPGVAGTGTSATFGTFVRASVGGVGAGGTVSTGLGGAAGLGMISGGPGVAASTTGLAGPSQGAAAPGGAGGAAGGGITSANVAGNGGPGGSSSAVAPTTYAGGVVDSTSPVAAGGGVIGGGLAGASGGGGAASITAAAQAGVAGGIYGGGGSGGGASLNGNASGAGGDGSPGIIMVITRF